MGSFFLIRKNLYNDLNGFDENFFVYFEEVDLSYRLYKSGYKSYYFSDTQIFHVGGGTSKNVKGKRLFYFLRSKIKYSFKHFAFLNALCLLLLIMFIEPLSRIFYLFIQMKSKEIIETIKGFYYLYLDLIFKKETR